MPSAEFSFVWGDNYLESCWPSTNHSTTRTQLTWTKTTSGGWYQVVVQVLETFSGRPPFLSSLYHAPFFTLFCTLHFAGYEPWSKWLSYNIHMYAYVSYVKASDCHILNVFTTGPKIFTAFLISCESWCTSNKPSAFWNQDFKCNYDILCVVSKIPFDKNCYSEMRHL